MLRAFPAPHALMLRCRSSIFGRSARMSRKKTAPGQAHKVKSRGVWIAPDLERKIKGEGGRRVNDPPYSHYLRLADLALGPMSPSPSALIGNPAPRKPPRVSSPKPPRPGYPKPPKTARPKPLPLVKPPKLDKRKPPKLDKPKPEKRPIPPKPSLLKPPKLTGE